MAPNTKELSVDNEWRAGMYLFLARVYRAEPDGELVQALGRDGCLSALSSALDDTVLLEHCRRVEAEAAAGLATQPDYLTRLREDFGQLFVGPGHLEAPPWESVYRSEERLVFGDHTFAVRAFYGEFGLESGRKNNEPDDHIALELEFMAYLCRLVGSGTTAADQKRGQTGQTAFLREHLTQWAPLFCADVAKYAATDFFRGLAGFTQQWLVLDVAGLASAAGAAGI